MRGRKTDWPRLLVDLTACFLIPAYTLLFAGSMAWFRTNFSVLAVAGKDSYRGFVLWGILAAAYFFTILLALARTLPQRRGRIVVRTLGSTACLCLTGALLVPYLPDNFPRFAKLHVLLAALACVLLMLALLAVCLACRREELEGWRYHLRDWGGIVFFSGVLFAAGGMVTSALEVFFTISAALLARRLWLLRRRKGKF